MQPSIRSTLHGVPSHEVQHLHAVGNVHVLKWRICKWKHFVLGHSFYIEADFITFFCLHFPFAAQGEKFANLIKAVKILEISLI